MKLSLIVAMSDNRVIGRAGGLPWHLSADLRRFKRLTMGHFLLMGRKTYESIGRPLPGRTSIVITRQSDYQVPAGVLLARSLEEALQMVRGEEEVFVIGGGEIYEQTLPLAARLYVTRVHAMVEGDTYFPTFDEQAWQIVEHSRHEPDQKNAYPYSFVTLERID